MHTPSALTGFLHFQSVTALEEALQQWVPCLWNFVPVSCHAGRSTARRAGDKGASHHLKKEEQDALGFALLIPFLDECSGRFVFPLDSC